MMVQSLPMFCGNFFNILSCTKDKEKSDNKIKAKKYDYQGPAVTIQSFNIENERLVKQSLLEEVIETFIES